MLPHEICPVDAVVDRGPRCDGRVVPDRRAVRDVEGSRLGRALGGRQRRERADGARDAAGARTRATPRSWRSCGAPKRAGRGCGAWATVSARTTRRSRSLVAVGAYFVSGSATRALSVLVVATPCPLILAIPVAIIGGISLAARRGIIVRDPAVLERLDTLPHGDLRQDGNAHLREAGPDRDRPRPGAMPRSEALSLAASRRAVLEAPAGGGGRRGGAREEGIGLSAADEIAEPPGRGLTGSHRRTAGRADGAQGDRRRIPLARRFRRPTAGLEAVMLVDGAVVARCFASATSRGTTAARSSSTWRRATA